MEDKILLICAIIGTLGTLIIVFWTIFKSKNKDSCLKQEISGSDNTQNNNSVNNTNISKNNGIIINELSIQSSNVVNKPTLESNNDLNEIARDLLLKFINDETKTYKMIKHGDASLVGYHYNLGTEDLPKNETPKDMAIFEEEGIKVLILSGFIEIDKSMGSRLCYKLTSKGFLYK